MIKPQTLKGFRDFLPEESRKRQYVINTLKKVFELYGFEPLETPALEYEEILLGKYGEEGDKLLYRFEDLGKRKVALRYDQTVPLARVVAQYQDILPMPFKRYQIQPVWRAENTQKGRYREFVQCDIDTVGTSSPLSDAEIIATAVKGLEKLGFKNYKINFNSREVLFEKIRQAGVPENLVLTAIRIMDKIKKVGWEKINQELINSGISEKSANTLNELHSKTQPIEGKNMNEIWEICFKMGIKLNWDLTLARGLDYYTGLIFEIEIPEYQAGSICGGGRYDNLIGMFAYKQIPAVGCAFGFDRTIEAMDALNLFPAEMTTATVLVTVFSPELKNSSLKLSSQLRSNNIYTELYLDEKIKLDKQLKYADKKGIPYALIIGPDEVKNNSVTLKNLKEKSQRTISQNELLAQLLKSS